MIPETMRYASVAAKDFALQALCRSDSSLVGKPVALVRGEGRKAVVAEARAGTEITPGLPVALAFARCPDIRLLPRDPAAEVEAQRLMIAAAFTLSPRVEASASGMCTVDLRGADEERIPSRALALVAELAIGGIAAVVGIARTPLLAWYAASAPAEGSVRILEDEAAFLSDLPLEAALPTETHAEVLGRWGLITCGQLTAIGKAEIGRRLGAEGVDLWERAAGETARVLRLVEPAKTFAAEWIYEPPVESAEPLLFRLRRFAERIALELRGAGFAAEKLALTLLLEDETDYRREFRLPEAGTDVDGWMRILSAHLEAVRTPSRVAGARLAASPARPPEKQQGLFDVGLRDPNAFWENLARLSAVVGSERVGTPALLNSHKPDAFAMERPAEAVPPAAEAPVHPLRGPVLRRFRPPLDVRVELLGNRPGRVEGRAIRGEVASCRGPWHESGEWWREDAWSRETWQVELSQGGLYLLARTAQRWAIEGALD